MCNFSILCASAQGRDSKEDERVRGFEELVAAKAVGE